jgi:hypothetical protein
MFGSDFAIDRFLGSAGFVSVWINTPEYHNKITELEAQANRWEASTIGLPILAAVFLPFGRKVNSDLVELPGARVRTDEPDE